MYAWKTGTAVNAFAHEKANAMQSLNNEEECMTPTALAKDTILLYAQISRID